MQTSLNTSPNSVIGHISRLACPLHSWIPYNHTPPSYSQGRLLYIFHQLHTHPLIATAVRSTIDRINFGHQASDNIGFFSSHSTLAPFARRTFLTIAGIGPDIAAFSFFSVCIGTGFYISFGPLAACSHILCLPRWVWARSVSSPFSLYFLLL